MKNTEVPSAASIHASYFSMTEVIYVKETKVDVTSAWWCFSRTFLIEISQQSSEDSIIILSSNSL